MKKQKKGFDGPPSFSDNLNWFFAAETPSRSSDNPASPPVRKAVTLFDHVDHIKKIQNPDYFSTLGDADKRSFSNRMVCKFLSMNVDYLEAVNILQKYQDALPPEAFYRLCIGFLPKRKNAFDKYIKSFRVWTAPEMFFVRLIAKHHEVSEAEADEYSKVLTAIGKDKEYLEWLCKKYGMNAEEETARIKKEENL